MTSFTLRAMSAACLLASSQAGAQITFYEHDDYQGRNFTTQSAVGNFSEFGFNDRASSVVVSHDRWEVCQNARFAGTCVVLRPGRYASLSALGLNDRVSSVRMVGRSTQVANERYAPGPPAAYYDSRRRGNERLYEANVSSVHAVLGNAEKRCWTERTSVGEERGSPNVPGALVGALLGGILGHQVGGGTGRDIATVGGVVAGAAVGSNVNRGGNNDRMQNVQRCETVPSGSRTEYWDVTYNFRGVDHRIQMATQPGPTVTVNRQGEPRA